MDDFLSRSAEILATHPHLFDGGLSRGLLYGSLALILGVQLWRRLAPQAVLPLRQIRLLVGIAGVAGLALAINALALQVAFPFGSDDMPLLADGSSYLQVLQGSFGLTWAVFGAFFVLALWQLHASWGWLFGLGMALCLSANSHAAEAGLLSWIFVVDAMHLVLGLGWLGGVFVLAWLRFGSNTGVTVETIKAWSHLALPLFLSILALGVVRLLLTLRAEDSINVFYGGMLALKIAAVLVVMVQANKLRIELRRSRLVWRRFDDGLSMELFAAFILILLTALLTQLQPN
jgi:hypothetical protein